MIRSFASIWIRNKWTNVGLLSNWTKLHCMVPGCGAMVVWGFFQALFSLSIYFCPFWAGSICSIVDQMNWKRGLAGSILCTEIWCLLVGGSVVLWICIWLRVLRVAYLLSYPCLLTKCTMLLNCWSPQCSWTVPTSNPQCCSTQLGCFCCVVTQVVGSKTYKRLFLWQRFPQLQERKKKRCKKQKRWKKQKRRKKRREGKRNEASSQLQSNLLLAMWFACYLDRTQSQQQCSLLVPIKSGLSPSMNICYFCCGYMSWMQSDVVAGKSCLNSPMPYLWH